MYTNNIGHVLVYHKLTKRVSPAQQDWLLLALAYTQVQQTHKNHDLDFQYQSIHVFIQQIKELTICD